MLNIGIIKILLYIFVPWLVGWGISLIGGNRQKTKQFEFRNLAFRERFIYIAALISIVHYLYYICGGAPQNIFETIKTSRESPMFSLRDGYNEYILKRCNQSEEFKREYEKYCRSEIDNLAEYPRLRRMVKSRIFGAGVNRFEYEIRHYEYVLEKLKSPIKRGFYLKYGEDSLIDCKFCQDDMDYWLFIGPFVMLSYAQFFVLVGLITSLPQRYNWRTPALVCGIAILVGEALYYISPNEMGSIDLYSMIFGENDRIGSYQKLDITRNICFLGILVFITLFRNGGKSSKASILRRMIRKGQDVLVLNEISRLMRITALEHPELRKIYLAHYQRIETDTINDIQKKQTRLRQRDLESILKTAKTQTSETMNRIREASSGPEITFNKDQ